MKLSHNAWGGRRQILIVIHSKLILSRDYVSLKYGSASQSTLWSPDLFHNAPSNSSVCCESRALPLLVHGDLATIRSVLEIMFTDSPTNEAIAAPER